MSDLSLSEIGPEKETGPEQVFFERPVVIKKGF